MCGNQYKINAIDSRSIKLFFVYAVLMWLFCLLFLLHASCQVQKGNDKYLEKNYLKYDSKHYILYAPNKKELDYAKEELNYSVKQFKKYLGEAPPKIAVVIVNDLDEMSNIDFSEFLGDKKMWVFPWVSRNFLNEISKEISLVREWGIIIQKIKNNHFVVLTILPFLKNDFGFKENDTIINVNYKEFGSIFDFEKYYNEIAIHDSVSVTVLRANNQLKVLQFLKPKHEISADTQLSTIDTESEIDSSTELSKVLSHEAAHIYFTSYKQNKLWKTINDQLKVNDTTSTTNWFYSKQALVEDWLNEGIPMLCEPDTFKKKRINSMKHHLAKGNYIPFSELFVMTHPLVQLNNIEKKEDQEKKGSKSVFKIKYYSSLEESNLSDKEKELRRLEIIFYPQTFSVLQFFIEKEGENIIQKLVNAYLCHTSIEEVFINTKTLPSDLRELENEWKYWLKSK